MTKVFDASALLAVVFCEPGGDVVIRNLDDPEPCISAVNWAEVATKMADQGASPAQVLQELAHLRVNVAPLDESLALDAAALRASTRKLGLSLGDRCCLALAKRLSAEVITADRAWAKLPGVKVKLIR